MEPIHLVYVTVPDRPTALRLAAQMVEQELAACANVGGPITAVYRWEGRIEEGEEWSLLLKTSADRLDALSAALIAAHPYEVPCVVALPSSGGSAAFHAWVRAACAAGDPTPE